MTLSLLGSPGRPDVGPTRDTGLDQRFAAIVDELTRRGLLAGALGTAALAGLPACGGSDPAPARGGGSWSFTDDLGRTVRLDRAPRRIVALNDLLAATLWSQGLHTIVGAPLYTGNAYILDAGGVSAAERARMTPVSGTAGPDPEKVAKAAPDLMVTIADSVENSLVTAIPALAKIAPWIGINAQSAGFEAIMASGARLLGALDVEEADLSAKADYDTQAARLRSALAAKPGLRIGFVFTADANGIELMGAEQWPCLLTLGGLGANLAKISGSDPYFQQVSWENVADLPLDLVVYTEGEGGQPDVRQRPWNQPTWQWMPAIKNGQYLNSGQNWYVYNYATFAGLLRDLADAVGKAVPGIGPR
ncbi:ABC transporter substrate-binding protein [Dactylosporangium sp. CA-092794]|uniref:ABC transporter substrate-binding protein n=1 Tax=Dactylosporangium sp. CA-092794 TaxID=3239929 RepID=UPI003D913FC2